MRLWLPATSTSSRFGPVSGGRTGRSRPGRRASAARPRRARAGASSRACPGGCSGKARHSTADRAALRRRATGDAGARRSSADDQRQLAEVAVAQLVDDRRPGLVELLRARRGALAGDAVGLLDEDDAAAARDRRLGRGGQVGGVDRAARAVAEHEQGAGAVGGRRCARAGPCGVSISRPATRSGGRLGDGLLEVLVHEGDRHAALADRGGDALDRAGPDVAAGEDPGTLVSSR